MQKCSYVCDTLMAQGRVLITWLKGVQGGLHTAATLVM